MGIVLVDPGWSRAMERCVPIVPSIDTVTVLSWGGGCDRDTGSGCRSLSRIADGIAGERWLKGGRRYAEAGQWDIGFI